MCVIIHLLPNKSVPDEMLYNAAANNWHSWGIIIKKPDDKLQVIREVPEKGTHTDLAKIMDILNKNIDCERFIHFRHNTRGETTIENTHPFLVHQDTKRKVWFMHNGTFTTYGTGVNNPKSDTLEFVEQFLTPALGGWVGGRGKGDYTDPFFHKSVLQPGFDRAGGSNRGLIVANDLPVVKLGSWYRFNQEGNVCHMDSAIAFSASNDDYFKEIKRGPIKDAQIAEENRKREEERQRTAGVVSQSTTSLNGRRVERFSNDDFRIDSDVFDGLQAYFGDGINLLDDEDLAALGCNTHEEFKAFVEGCKEHDKLDMIVAMVEHITIRFKNLYEKHVTANPMKRVG